MEQRIMQIDIPKQVENLALPDPALITFYKNIQDRILWLDTEVDENWIEFVKYIWRWNMEDKDKPQEERMPIKLYINSPGGDLDMNTLLIDIIKLSKTKIVGIGAGLVCSAACFIYMACHERLTLPHSKFLLHSGSADNISGTADQIQAYNAQYKKEIKQLKEYLYDYIPKKTVDSKMRGEWFFDAKEAVDLGVAHRIIESLDEVV